jgi:hypothetical protein
VLVTPKYTVLVKVQCVQQISVHLPLLLFCFQMVSKPAFIVEVSKGGDATLAIHCAFPAADVDVPAEEEGEHYGGFWSCCFAYCTRMCVVSLFMLHGKILVLCAQLI